MVAELSAGGTQHGCALVEYAVALAGPVGIGISTPRYDVEFVEDVANGGTWGTDPFPIDMPIPNGLTVPSGSDGHVAVADPSTNLVYGLWQSTGTSPTAGATWGGVADLGGDGQDWSGTSSTGCGISRWAMVIRVAEIAAGRIDHTLFFSTDMAAGSYRYPAGKSDGWNAASAAHPVPEGARVQLDPSIDLSAISGITTGELIVGRALQRYGAICGDNGGSRMGFPFELASDASPATPGAVYTAAGLEWDYFDMSHLPWADLRVLSRWDGI